MKAEFPAAPERSMSGYTFRCLSQQKLLFLTSEVELKQASVHCQLTSLNHLEEIMLPSVLLLTKQHGLH